MPSKTAKFAKKLAEIECIPPELEGLSASQVEALHVLKYEVLAALHRLYRTLPQDRADRILDKAFS